MTDIKSEVDQTGKKIFRFRCEVKDKDGIIIASLTKDVCVRRKVKD